MGRLKKLSIFVLALIVATASIPFYAVSASGEGTADNPILISTADDLELLRTGNSGKYYRLEKNIYLNDTQNYDKWSASAPVAETDGETVAFDSSGWFEGDGETGFITPDNEWTPIENFSGTLDGNGFIIFGLYVNSDEAGFIKNNNGTVKKLGFEKFLVASSGTTGTVAAVNNGSLTEVYANGKVISDGNNVGGLVGINNGTVIDCASYGSTQGIERVGGLVGLNTASVQTSFVSGTVKGASSEGAVCGDSAKLVGTASVTNCYHCVEDATDDNAQYKSTYTSAFTGFSLGVWQFDENGNEFPKLRWAADSTDNRCGDDLYWTLDEDGTFTFDGTSGLYDFNEAPWSEDADSVTSFNIGKDLTNIDDSILKAISAFENLETISVDWDNDTYQTDVDGKFLMKEDEIVIGLSNELPDTATSIGEYAFYGRNIDSIIVNESIDNEGKEGSRADGTGIVTIKAHAFENSTLSQITVVGNPEIQAKAIPQTATIKGFKNTNSESYAETNGNKFELLDNFCCAGYQNPCESATTKNYFRFVEKMTYAGYYDTANIHIVAVMKKNGKESKKFIDFKVKTVYKYLGSEAGGTYAGDDAYFSMVKMTGLPLDADYVEFTFTPSVKNIYGGEVTLDSKTLIFTAEKLAHEPTEEDYDDGDGILNLSDKTSDGTSISWSDFEDRWLKLSSLENDGNVITWKNFR